MNKAAIIAGALLSLTAACRQGGDLFDQPGHPTSMANSLKIIVKITLHLDSNPLLEQILLLGQQFRGQFTKTLAGIWTIGSATEIDSRI